MDVDERRLGGRPGSHRCSANTAGSTRWWPAPDGAWPEPSNRPRSPTPRTRWRPTSGARCGWCRGPAGHAPPAGRGRIILISSIGGIIGIPFQAFYSASKFALEGYGESLAYEVAPFGIQVTLVEPGNVRTDFTESRREVASARRRRRLPAAVAKAVGTMAEDEANGVPPDDVAAAVATGPRSDGPPRRVSVGKLDERVGIIGKRLLPYRLFERAAKGSLGV